MLGNGSPAAPLTDDVLADQLTAMGWTIVKMTTLQPHRAAGSCRQPQPAGHLGGPQNLGGETPPLDNLYTCAGLFDLEPGQSLQLEFTPPETRYWSVTLESIWHECLEPLVRQSSVTNKGSRRTRRPVRLTIGAEDRGDGFWLDTGGRRRGFITLRGWTTRKPRRDGSTCWTKETQR